MAESHSTEASPTPQALGAGRRWYRANYPDGPNISPDTSCQPACPSCFCTVAAVPGALQAGPVSRLRILSAIQVKQLCGRYVVLMPPNLTKDPSTVKLEGL